MTMCFFASVQHINDNGLAIGARHITVSTSGLAPYCDFANEGVQARFLSPRAHNDRPHQHNRSSSLEKPFSYRVLHPDKSNRRVTF